MAIILAVFISPVAAQYVSTTPSGINMGEVERGSSNELNFYIDTNAQSVFELNPRVETAPFSTVSSSVSEDNISEKDISDWVEFTQDSFTVNPQTRREYTLPNGENTSAVGSISMRLNVPQSRSLSEPGYYMFKLRPNPEFGDGGGTGFGSTTMSVALPNVLFRVPGEVERNIRVTNAEALRIGSNSIQIVLQFQNTGTVTTSYESFALPIKEGDRQVGVVNIPGYDIAPGESIEADVIWNTDQEGGVYTLEGPLDYMSGQSYVEEDISFTDTPQAPRQVDEPEGGTQGGGDDGSFPLWLFMLFLLALSTVMYSFEFDLFSIMIVVGGIGLAGLILFTQASNLLLLLLLTSFTVMYYYGGN